jgi:hypothetical protein
MTDGDSRELGMRRRREILGDEYVDANLAGADELTRTFQDLVTVQVWGRAWTGDAIDDRTRALVTLGILSALGRSEEVETYAKAPSAAEPLSMTSAMSSSMSRRTAALPPDARPSSRRRGDSRPSGRSRADADPARCVTFRGDARMQCP